jgi:hypothetical protein
MPCCCDMNEGDIYTCAECGIELEVVKGCAHEEGESCSTEECKMTCCGEELKLKE